MTRVAVSVEGPTEEAFVKEVLAPHLAGREVWLTPIGMGGNITLDRVAPELYRLSFGHDVVTTCYDFYGFKRRPAPDAAGVETAIGDAAAGIFERNGRPFRPGTIRPYIQVHEFEALLFADVRAFNVLPDVTPMDVAALDRVRAAIDTPEDINDSPQTSPSHRLMSMPFRYDKVEHGPILALEIGLPAMRAACPRFDAWVGWLEGL